MRIWMAVAALLLSGVAVADVSVTDTVLHEGTYDVRISNGTSEAIPSVIMSVEFVTPGRSVPWASHETSVDIPGGIEPGESRWVRGIREPVDLFFSEAREIGSPYGELETRVVDISAPR